MPDRIRESVFAILSSHYDLPGTLPPIAAADMFSGSGSMGLEAVSRGAAACDFIENGKLAAGTLRRNLATLEAGPTCRVVAANAWTAPLTTPRPSHPYALIFLDPPYSDARDVTPHGRVPRLLADLRRASWMNESTVIVVHHEADVVMKPDERAGWRVYDRRVYGNAAITFIMQRIDSKAGD